MKTITLLMLSLFSFSVHASDPVLLDWSDLNAKAQKVNIQLPDLTEQQKRLLQGVNLLTNDPSEEAQSQRALIIEQLAAHGIDAEQALELRRQYMTEMKKSSETVNTSYDGQKVRVPGFVVPIEFNQDMLATKMLLVPVAGACIHMPPPPANQIVQISYPEGFELQNVQYPVWVEGNFHSNVTTEEVYLVDGKAAVSMGYEMEATLIEDYYEPES